MPTITLPAQTLDVLDAPVTVADTINALDEHGFYRGVVAIPTARMVGEHTYDDFYDNLASALISDCNPYQISYQVLGAAEDGHTLYMRVECNVAAAIEAEPEWAEDEVGLSPEQIAGVVARLG